MRATKPTSLLHTISLSIALASTAVMAAPTKGADMTMEEANQAMANPITEYTMFITENDTYKYQGDITEKARYQNVTLIEPLIPTSIGDTGWNLINRPVIPILRAEVPTDINPLTGHVDWDQKTALGDIVAFSLVKPPGQGAFQWGVGPTLTMPTATNDELGSEKWSAGPAAVALYSSPKVSYGALFQQWWSFSGNDDREDVSLTNLQYFFTYQFNKRWAFVTAPTISANWKADSDNVWSVPVSTGLTYSFFIGKSPARVVLEPQYFVVQPDDFGADWNVRLAFAMVLPKI